MFDESLEHNAYVHEEDRPPPDTQVGAVETPHKPMTPGGDTRKVVAHFMLGNTYPFTALNWEETFDLAEESGLDGLILNLGREEWQFRQARAAYLIAAKRLKAPVLGRSPIRLALSLDLNVMSSSEWSDAVALTTKIAGLMGSPAQLMHNDRPVLTAFDGHAASWGGKGWKGFFDELHQKMRFHVSFWPAWFQPPDDLIDNMLIDGLFSWNGAWPMGNRHISLSHDDMAYIASPKPFMASVSPLFFTHYGKTGEWAFDKNWIYRSDDLLYPSRWASILALSDARAPEIVQVISWNDYGESHNIAPVLGAEPGSSAWTRGMDHVAFREMTAYFARRWRDGEPEVADELVVWMWYRTHPKTLEASNDSVGRPDHANWALDLINAVVLVPAGLEDVELIVTNGPSGHGGKHAKHLSSGKSNAVTIPFQAGSVHFEVKSKLGTHMRHAAHEIYRKTEQYNFNMWSGAWRAKVPRVTKE
ncbi:glycoside hydrolase [Cutaneotrichosporon oleaginosum]|uniref:Glycoside hydrolase n=1 Tax=Cutaneotrichosporon oleaginosum TaxID=879819 RepID=A0A0J1B4Y2_9TREE|nr:glycoside hydrolase [Cutaneotrichosporon oleaginosum]KLT42749.1 glycoside hydrolase [Cutaneotrichosporon oleaginosum]TXT09532.1 hypothetical protein COLE_03466 [Cutaneotrichosporon oleaginosum]